MQRTHLLSSVDSREVVLTLIALKSRAKFVWTWGVGIWRGEKKETEFS